MLSASWMPHCLVLIVVWLFPCPAHAQARNFGREDCRCIEWAGLDDKLEGSCLMYKPAGEEGQQYCYPMDYGNGLCQKWDKELQPYCADEQGTPKANAPRWCRDEWCFVNKEDCNLPMVSRSTFFPDDNIYYSYQTCGNVNTFAAWFETGAEGHSAAELITVIEHYVRSLKSEIENQYPLLQGDQTCSTSSGCPCDGCEPQSAFKNRPVNFGQAMTMPRHGISINGKMTCLAKLQEEAYLRIAAKEYNDASRVGYIYYGDQAQGIFTQWPQMEWCPEASWDPRFRPWYAGASSGPKNVVLCVDDSGSMGDEGRMELARSAAKAVIDTLIWADYATIIPMNEDPYHNGLKPMIESERRNIKAWIDKKLINTGGTDFQEPLNKAFDILENNKGANCNNVILFLTDGSSGPPDFEEAQRRASANNIVIFTYALGSGASTGVMYQLAQDNRGYCQKISDGGDLAKAMSSYYRYFAAGIETDKPRWVMYNDWITGQELLASCLATYDAGKTPKDLLGVICMDINVIVDLYKLQSANGWEEFVVAYEEATQTCQKTSITDAHIENFRNAISDENKCEPCGALGCLNPVTLFAGIGVGAMLCVSACCGLWFQIKVINKQ